MRELRPGLWHWEAPHRDWEPGEPWPQVVSSYAIDDGQILVLFDPIAPPGEIEELAAKRDPLVVLTCPWHERDTRSVAERHGLPVYTPPAESEDDLMRKYGLTREQAAGGSPDVRWLLAGEAGEAHLYSAGDLLPAGIESFPRPGREENEAVLWIESHRAVVAGDALVDFGSGLELNLNFVREGLTREQAADALRPLLDAPVEHLLLTHGGPRDGAALERALRL
jgi:glyoxylase-like metal-dependent hydrolase (beta-lactamase superfamily II)